MCVYVYVHWCVDAYGRRYCVVSSYLSSFGPSPLIFCPLTTYILAPHHLSIGPTLFIYAQLVFF